MSHFIKLPRKDGIRCIKKFTLNNIVSGILTERENYLATSLFQINKTLLSMSVTKVTCTTLLEKYQTFFLHKPGGLQ